jgi:uncharacterized protein (DUF2126 family)/transglutaminase-like putative cysteine protease
MPPSRVRLLVQHRSHYRYPQPALLGTHTLRLHPASHAKASIETYRLSCEQAERIRWILDPHGNRVAQLSFAWPERLAALEVLVEMAVEIRPVNPFDFFVDHRCSELGFQYPDEYRSELEPFLRVADPAFETGARFEALLAELPSSGDVVQGLVEFNRRTHEAVAYVIREEAGVWTPEQTLAHGRGSCRDSAVLLVALLRRRGIAARFVSGYLIQVTDEGMLPDLPKGLDHDVADLHAWAEAYIPGAGWIGFDATSGLLAGEGHIPLACASTPALAAPLHGTADVLADQVEFSLSVARLGHEPRPTAPYTDEVWSALREAGRRCDARLAQLGLRMTIGGEPTFNAREDVDAPEWNAAALGPSKWRHGLRLIAELRERFAPGGVVLQRMGKHYPGESLPRWALDAIARTDGEQLWGEDAGGEIADAKQLAHELAHALGLSHALAPAYEDPWHFIDREARVPVDLDPLSFDLADGEERARLARVLGRDLREPVGWVLPLVREQGGSWRTQTWSFRRGHLFLLPGDSPIGLRLPLDSLAGKPDVIAPPELVYAGPQDPRLAPDVDQAKLELAAASPAGPSAIHTALCVELRERSVHVFLPPLERERDFIELVGVIDRVRAGRPVTLEGYPPPSGPLLERITVTPDPGVLEVNLPPRPDTEAHVELLEIVYDAALRAGLHSEKYLLDGRLAGSGGGHHLTLGGPTPLESPFVQRPDLLASLITFLQHHPSMSYMFTGLFVGATSQAPRVDEARPEQLDELELALAHAFAQREHETPPWLSDILFRNLLVDLSGNTHRTELSIDKLFDHRTPSGRSGLVEFRAFEMPPHPRMAAAQMLLVRSLATAFAEQPYQGPLVRWGAALHDRFLLPYWMWRDFEDVLAFLAARNLPLDPDGYRPFVDLRCPLVGHLQASDVRVELRNAIEPWNVLGEEQSATGTARYVDSSLERIEIRADGLIPERHAILVNGFALPLRPTERDGLFVGGVRFRAWAPPHSLHAHIGIHHPLRVDVLDRWATRSLGACTYHVWHPEGRGLATAPLTRFEAAARRQQRFTRGDQSAFPVTWTDAPGDAPYTVDLRRCDLGRPMPTPVEGEPAPEPRIERELMWGVAGTTTSR